jgi:hypothetical protein
MVELGSMRNFITELGFLPRMRLEVSVKARMTRENDQNYVNPNFFQENFHVGPIESPKVENCVSARRLCRSLSKPITSFRNARSIAPLYTSGPVAATQNGSKIITCIEESALLTDVLTGIEICRFAGVRVLLLYESVVYSPP